MQNDVLKNEIAPWQEKGRWYHAHITESGVDSVNTDQYLLDNVTFANDLIHLESSTACLVDYKIITRGVDTNNNTRTFYIQFGYRGNNKMRGLMPNLSQFTAIDFDIWLFIVDSINS